MLWSIYHSSHFFWSVFAWAPKRYIRNDVSYHTSTRYKMYSNNALAVLQKLNLRSAYTLMSRDLTTTRQQAHHKFRTNAGMPRSLCHRITLHGKVVPFFCIEAIFFGRGKARKGPVFFGRCVNSNFFWLKCFMNGGAPFNAP